MHLLQNYKKFDMTFLSKVPKQTPHHFKVIFFLNPGFYLIHIAHIEKNPM